MKSLVASTSRISTSSKVDQEEISSQYDHCESLLSDLEFLGKPNMSSTPISSVRQQKMEARQGKKSAKWHFSEFWNPNLYLGMESIKRQMDNLADMVNDLQLQMNKKTPSSEQKIDEEQNCVSEDDFSDTSPDSLPRNYLKRKKRLRWRSFYTGPG